MDTKLALECLSLFLLGVAYGALAEAYMSSLEYFRNREK